MFQYLYDKTQQFGWEQEILNWIQAQGTIWTTKRSNRENETITVASVWNTGETGDKYRQSPIHLLSTKDYL